VVHATEAELAEMGSHVTAMHQSSGLLEEIRTSTLSLDEAGEATLAFLRTHIDAPQTVPLCGNSIGTDRRFLARYLPDVEAFLHYRSVDVSSVKELCRRWYPDVLAGAPGKEGEHRALGDIRASVEELRYYRDHVFVPRTDRGDA
jgi:oligoribonuclease